MNIMLIILAVIAGGVCLLFIVGLFSKKSYAIERSVTIQKPVPDVFNYIRFLKNQDNYNKWVMMDPNMKKDFKGIDGTTGFIYGWDGNNKAGAGEQEIKQIEFGNHVDVEVRFKRPFKGIAHSLMKTMHDKQESTIVKWRFTSELKYPANIFLLLFNPEKTLGRDLESSLTNLRIQLEK
ncbi:MAG TPA: SRPBCC family protein [Chitinophagaceae bacterium]